MTTINLRDYYPVSYTHLDVYKRQILVILSVLLFITGETTGGIVFIILAFLFSPFGIPAIAEWLVLKLNDLKENLKDFITS